MKNLERRALHFGIPLKSGILLVQNLESTEVFNYASLDLNIK